MILKSGNRFSQSSPRQALHVPTRLMHFRVARGSPIVAVTIGETAMHIGIAGIGKMGSNIAQRLMECGHKLTVWNRSSDKTKPLAEAGASVARTPAELASAVETVITIVTNADAIDAVYDGPQGLLAGDVKGKLFIEMSTVPPEAQVARAGKVRAKGAGYVECPVSGSVIPARSGKLLGLMGGEPEDAARARPILDQLCRRVQYAGPAGSGALLKLAVNLPLMIYWQALGEQLALCKDLKIDPKDLLDFLSETSGAATVLKQRMPGIVARLKNEKSDIRTFNLDGGIKDVKAMLAEGKRRGVELPLLQQTLACYETARRTMAGDDEVSNVSAHWAGRFKS
jgi:3-hydroxyisobutyrate dehydrogenase